MNVEPGESDTGELQFQDVLDARVQIPEMILTGIEKRPGMAKFQMLTFLVQNELKHKDYRFDACRYLPYSTDLACDIESKCSKTNWTTIKKAGDYCRYFIDTKKLDTSYKEFIEQYVNQKPVSQYWSYTIAALNMSKYNVTDFLEFVYSKYKSGMDGSHDDITHILSEADRVLPPIKSIFEKHYTRESMQILAGMENIKNILKWVAKSKDPIKSRILCNISMAMVENCSGISEKLDPKIPVKTDQSPQNLQLMMFCELEQILVSYAADNDIMMNPYTMPWDVVLKKGDVKRLKAGLAEIGTLN